MTPAGVFRHQTWWSTPIWVAVGTAAAYGALLGWDQDNSYDAGQVAVLVVLVGALAVWAGGFRAVWLSSFAATVVMTTLWSIDAASDSLNDGLWPIGAVSVFVGMALGFTAVAYFQRWRTGVSTSTDSGSVRSGR